MNPEVEVIQVIRTTLEVRGEGVESDPIRRITQFWTFDGKLLAEVDPQTATNPFSRLEPNAHA